MRLPSLLSFLALGLTLVSAAAVVSAPQEDCFTGGEVRCWQSGRTLYADKAKALEAITKACGKMACSYGTAPSPGTVSGSVPGFTAVLTVGNKCAGLNPWSTEGCVGLFQMYLFPQCKTEGSLPWPDFPPEPFPPQEPVTFPLASISGTCGQDGDGSSLSFNIGG